ncbi:protoporphyrinogen/coproporphyrinogen oxidase [Belliella kenyensis]|uniref:Protoporphyrinogen/coproporphyrinogen oxidase n=1 Tax=Belliella kenyensis TaxID=1472724 RepID=A0ABV8EIM5_9BACT|nr:NAD(P)/FAD-dependent oxidoreductase [Belliella kenyensis]MCH7400255.1 FAD-dependent oxidoreductase [Belliella kenyensis]MDN3604728.1 NAD(P)/FAD-dependent oxidoreductase [Belliella kenyensis]
MNVYIIGAGVSGLIAAFELERSGNTPIILESSDRVGGRIATDLHEGFLLDRGFQVLLTAYPEARRYLDYDALNLKFFTPGARIIHPGNSYTISDPMRNPSQLISMILSKVGSLSDKLKIRKLNLELSRKSIDEIFESPSLTTLAYLKEYGFSSKIINNFFKPFFSGIFLENELNTSSRMFQFVFKMFGEGHAAVPEKGMGEIANYLKNKLTHTEIRLNTPVLSIEGPKITLQNGEIIEAEKIIVTCRPDLVIDQLKGEFKPSRSVYNLYFSLERSFMIQPLIALVPDEKFLINNLVFMTDVSKYYSSSGKALLSVSVTKPVKNEGSLVDLIKIELEALSGISAEFFKHIKTYKIKEALPQVDDMKANLPFTNSKLNDHVFLAGDYMLNGSINAAMTSGRKAAEAVILSAQNPF